MSTILQTEGNGPDGSHFIKHRSEQELKQLTGKHVILGVVDGNRIEFYVSKEFAARLTLRDVKAMADKVYTTLRVVCEQEGNPLR